LFPFCEDVFVRAIAAMLPKINFRRGQFKDELIVKRNKTFWQPLWKNNPKYSGKFFKMYYLWHIQIALL
jgi:hypothetical protein